MTMLVRATLLIATLTVAGCASAASAPADGWPNVDAVLDDFHDAAADGDADRYLDHFADNGVFFGTDPAERWTKQQFEPYVRRGFASGGWTYVPRDRTSFISADGDVAWFDEMLDAPSGTVARGTGVLVRVDGEWKVAQYNFSVPFPNSLWDTILEMIRAERD
jgi:ketosteroid isomerase-like protein